MYIRREGDMPRLTEIAKGFESSNNESLISDYNRQSRCGITGVHSQALYLMATGHIFFKRFGESPIYMENNLLRIRGQVKLSGDTFEYNE